MRLVTDYARLNLAVERPVHPFPSAQDIMRSVRPESKVFAKFDAVHGYFQVPLDEASQKLTTFLLPEGKFCYTVAPMGLCSSGDEFCARTDEAFRGLDVAKIVDDCLLQAENYEDLFAKIDEFLKRCEQHGVALSLKKVEVGDKVKMAGYVVASDGVRPDPDKVKAIREFATPADIHMLRSYLGMVNQLSIFFPELTRLVMPMQGLMRKGVRYHWTPDLQKAFVTSKEYLTSDAVVKPFNPELETMLLTDASRLYGLGYILMQKDMSGRHHIVQAGSRSLSSAEKNYATIELECLGVQWATRCCDHYLAGCPRFEVVTDHKPLLGVFAKSFVDLENPRLRRICEKLQTYRFHARWTAGKEHQIADALSRHPVECAAVSRADGFTDLDEELECIVNNKAFAWLKSAASAESYKSLIEAIRSGEDDKLSEFRRIKDELAVHELSDGVTLVTWRGRLVVPKGARRMLVRILHLSHSGLVKTMERAKASFYWPSMSSDVKNTIEACEACQRRRPQQQVEPMDACVADYPMQMMGVDLFETAGTKWMLAVDRYSGFLWAKRLTTTTTRAVTGALMTIFSQFGYPERVRTDGGPQFRSEFAEFCAERGITHELASAYNPNSNGLAEAGVKNAKYLIEKCRECKEDCEAALLEWRATPRADGISPAEAFFGRKVRTLLPEVRGIKKGTVGRLRSEVTKERHDAAARPARYATIRVGGRVRVWNVATASWDQTGVVLARRSSGKSYEVRLDGRNDVSPRARRHLRPVED